MCILLLHTFILFFFFNDTATTEIYTLSLHDALPISGVLGSVELEVVHAIVGFFPAEHVVASWTVARDPRQSRSEEHTSELQSRLHLVCRLLLEKKKQYIKCD